MVLVELIVFITDLFAVLTKDVFLVRLKIFITSGLDVACSASHFSRQGG